MNINESIDLHSKLTIRGMDKMMKNALVIQNMGIRSDKLFSNRMPQVLQNTYQNNFNDLSLQISKIVRNNYGDRFSSITRGFQKMQKSQIEQLSLGMQSWQLDLGRMSFDFSKNYNNLIEDSMKNLFAGITTMNYSNFNFGSLGALKIDDLRAKINNIKEMKFDESLENKIDMDKVEILVTSKLEDLKLSMQEESADIVLAINRLTEVVVESNTKGSIKDNVVSSVMAEIVLKMLYWVLAFAMSYSGLSMPAIANGNQIIKSIRKEVSTMDVDYDFYNSFRIVSKDGLEVRNSNKIKTGVKYYLNFGDTVEIEHKNKNWTKISYTNMLTGERERGWVLTRYIKRFD
ncbi:MAG TPA: SH3 domain-containing protein [Epulopiscium sp.]|nr:SH3 domain-containing protein [Candidatus Epulonipiscium sp.]